MSIFSDILVFSVLNYNKMTQILSCYY